MSVIAIQSVDERLSSRCVGVKPLSESETEIGGFPAMDARSPALRREGVVLVWKGRQYAPPPPPPRWILRRGGHVVFLFITVSQQSDWAWNVSSDKPRKIQVFLNGRRGPIR